MNLERGKVNDRAPDDLVQQKLFDDIIARLRSNMKIYGIKTCGSVRKAMKYFDELGLEYEFIDFKKESVPQEKIDEWLKHIDINKLFNSRGTKYKNLKLKELNLNDQEKAQWLAKENMLIKRPVVEYNDKVIVAFDENIYNEIFKK